VSASGAGSPAVGLGSGVARGKSFTLPAGGITCQASSLLMSSRRLAAYLLDSKTSSGTSTNCGSP
jgi:hypothetical protein